MLYTENLVNFCDLSYNIPYSGYIPILQGEGKGMLWKRHIGNEGYWLGSYESWKQKTIAPFLIPGVVFYDVGAYAGFYTLIAYKRGCFTFAFEPDKENQELFLDHIKKNKCESSVKLMPFAVSDENGIARFKKGQSGMTNQLSDEGEIEVKTITLDSFMQEKGYKPPMVIKIDAEGAERKILLGAQKTISEYKPIILLEGPKKYFEDLIPDYKLKEIYQDEWLAIPV